MFEYVEKIIGQIERIASSQQEKIAEAGRQVARTLLENRLIHTFGTGHSHMIGLEPFVRAGGLANVNAMLDSIVMTSEGARRSAEIERISGLAEVIWDGHHIHASDLMIVISNSGRNAMPIEMAMKAKTEGLFTIGISSLEQSKKYPSRHQSGKKLYELADLLIDNCVPPGDGLMRIGGNLTGPASSISGMLIMNTILTEGMKLAARQGVKLPIYFSQNIDGFSNEELYARFEKRIKHL